MESRTRGATKGGGNIVETALSNILKSKGAKPGAVMEEMTKKAALTLPQGLASMLLPEPTTLSQAMPSPGCNHWKRAM